MDVKRTVEFSLETLEQEKEALEAEIKYRSFSVSQWSMHTTSKKGRVRGEGWLEGKGEELEAETDALSRMHSPHHLTSPPHPTPRHAPQRDGA